MLAAGDRLDKPMPKRRRRTPRYSVPVVESPQPITPESGLRITLKQALVAIAIILGAGGAYGALKWDQAETRRDVAEIRKTQEQFTAATPAALKDQDDKRAKLGEAFLASNKAIADKVGELATAVAVQQADARATQAALAKIAEQLNTIVVNQRATQPKR